MGESGDGEGADRPQGALSDLEVEVLDFAALRWRYLGAKESAVRERFGWSLTRYAQVLNGLLERPEAAAHAPQLVARPRRLRDARADQRRDGRDG